MFALIIILVSIALVVALAAATIFYGGATSVKAATHALAHTLLNQATQIDAAGVVAVAQGDDWPTGAPLFSAQYLSSMPLPPKGAYADTAEIPNVSHWTYYTDQSVPSPAHHFVLKNKINRDVCMEVNKEQGLVGIPAVWDGVSLIQCFGPGVAVRPGSALGYTFFYDPKGTTSSQNEMALTLSKTEGGSSTPGYPRACPDGSSITSGLCVNSDPVAQPNTPPPQSASPSVYHVLTEPGVVLVDGTLPEGYISYCSLDAPAGVFDASSTVNIGGVALHPDAVYPSYGAQCIDVYANHPAMPGGSYPVVISNSDGSTAVGTIQYVDTVENAPIVTGISPDNGPADEVSTTVITGSGFTPQTRVYGAYVRLLPVQYIDSSHLAVTVPVAGTSDDGSIWPVVSLEVQNSGSFEASDVFNFSYVASNKTVNLTASTTSLALHDFVIVPGGSTGGIANESHGVINFVNNTAYSAIVSGASMVSDATHFQFAENTCTGTLAPGQGCRFIIHYVGEHIHNFDPMDESLSTLGVAFGAVRHTTAIQLTTQVAGAPAVTQEVATLVGDTLGVAWVGSTKYAGSMAVGPGALCAARAVLKNGNWLCYEQREIDPDNPEVPSVLNWELVTPDGSVFPDSHGPGGTPPANWWTP